LPLGQAIFGGGELGFAAEVGGGEVLDCGVKDGLLKQSSPGAI
jgi:hypothetical protein